MSEKIKFNFNLYTWEKIKEIFFNKKFENIILFSQPRSGSTFVSNILIKELNCFNNFFPEEFFINQHFVYLKSFIKKHNNFFINTNEYWFRRTEIKKNKTMYIYLYRDSKEIMDSYLKAKKLNYYFGWEEMINKYRILFPEIKDFEPVSLFGHKVWEKQINKFENAFTLSYESFKTHNLFLNASERNKNIKDLKDIELVENTFIEKKMTNKMEGKISINEKRKLNFNIIEKLYFFVRRKIDSKKKSRKNY